MKLSGYGSRKRIAGTLLLCFFTACGINAAFLSAAYARDAKAGYEEGDASSSTPRDTAKEAKSLVSLNFKDTDMREVLAILAYKGGVNIVAGEDVTVKVSVQLKDVPWEQALDVILKTYNYTYKKEGNLIRVMSLVRALEEESKVPTVTKIISLNFAKVDDLKTSLAKMLSKRGTLEVDKRTNSLLVTDIPEVVVNVEEAAIQLDTRTPQVLIEAMMVDLKLTDNDQWGSALTLLDLKSPADSNTLRTSMSAAGTNTFNFNTLAENFSISGLLDMWISQNKATILANPKVLTLDNQEAKIEITEEIPYLETVDSGSGTTTNVKFKEAGIKLFVTPHITTGSFVSMNVRQEQSFKSGELGGQPIIDGRKAETNLLVKDGETIVIGGLRQSRDNITFEKLPVFGDVPFFGIFFRKKTIEKIDTELVLFVTPHIIREAVLSDNEKMLFDKLGNTARVVMDERTELQKLNDITKKIAEKLKAKEVEKKEVEKRHKVHKHRPLREAEVPVVEHEQEKTAPEAQPAEGVSEWELKLEYEEAMFRESLDSIIKATQ
ncbi:MAG: secretin and TonB N-terminal domain-containing protein [Candidatus Omnitrophica bacterium]|nr:secretin and TonB N-terminal domain-containing protein [Candidatus Omnitrophota bacterium]MBU4478376.1 secretin and TonB N-terminal domain-containing protein [Candidatus Omnitrophota bacterium]MCG2703957.1 secretin and TonB N-terminal domain-containing protein [Candidatus Omnitrophota bacterium]